MPDVWAIMRAIRGSDLPPTDRHILMTLASLADAESGMIPDRFMPSLSELARMTGLGRSTVARRMPAIEDSGWVKKTAPPVVNAWRDKEKNSYRLLIPVGGAPEPTSPTVGLVPERDQSEGWSQSGTSPIPGLVLVPERDRTSPTVGLEVPDLRTKRTTTSPSERSRRTKTKPKPTDDEPADPNAGQILKELIDHCKANGVQLPKRLIGHYAKEIKDRLDEKFSPDIVRRALQHMVATDLIDRPSLLANKVVTVQTGADKRNEQGRRNGGMRGYQAHVPYQDPVDQSAYDEKL